MGKDLVDRIGGVPGGAKTYAASAGLVALGPVTMPLLRKVAKRGFKKAGGAVKETVTGKVSDAMPSGDSVKEKLSEAVPGGGAVKKLSEAMPGGGGGGGGAEGVGKGRRMPVQQAAEIGVPLSVAYNEFTQFEQWPQYMHRVQQVSQEDDTHVTFKAKIWGFSREYKAEIVEQRPDERIKWKVTEGMTHTGVVTFHPLGERLTRVQVTLDVEPSGLIEKAARGMRHVKRAVRADLARFKAHLEMEEDASGEWRGTIEDGKKKRSTSRRSSSGSGSSERRRSSHRRERAGARG
jgi:uncharacterized membrane protein